MGEREMADLMVIADNEWLTRYFKISLEGIQYAHSKVKLSAIARQGLPLKQYDHCRHNELILFSFLLTYSPYFYIFRDPQSLSIHTGTVMQLVILSM